MRRVFPNVSNRLAYRYQAFLPLGFREYLRRHALDFDVAHLHACRNLPAAFASRYLRRAGVPYVVAPNGTAPVIERRRMAKRVFDAAVGHRIMANAARVLAVSAAERRQLIDIGVAPTAVRQVPNPVDLREFSSAVPRGRCRATWGVADAPVVLFLGKISPRKNVDVLVRAFALLGPDVRLVIAGNDMGGGQQARQLVQHLGLAGRTLFTGLLTGVDRLHALADADVVVYASEHEVFGLVPFEALLAGTPVVVADDSGCGDLVGQTGGGLVVPVNDVLALAQAIRDVLARPGDWRRAAAQAAVAIRERYATDVVCAVLETVYSELVAAGLPPPRSAPRRAAPGQSEGGTAHTTSPRTEAKQPEAWSA